ncbi:O-Mevalon transferase yanI [Pseudocercospora fuligena]|uniref:O-Mevalon transferase yanI n=1 Tax=Pseudocercospora fuligena TaxID=685502 RepID=A0A8H6RIK2_9PEZI|nr:O-Mevalon transferase yanI [Pseudocercospora fuligena]
MGLPAGLKTPREVKAFYDQRYQSLIDSGEYVPFLYPWATLGAAVILVYLLIDHRRSSTLRALRFPLFGFLCAFSGWSILNHKARSAAGAYGVGLVQSWGTLWTGAIMFFNDCQTDLKRIERADTEASRKTDATGKDVSNGSATKNDANGNIKHGSTSTEGPSRKPGSLIWQSYPEHFSVQRLDWVADVFCNFRGVGWSFETNGIPPPPDFVELELYGSNESARQSISNGTMTISRTGIRRFHDRKALLKDTIFRLALGAIALDAIKCLMHCDAYFWGYMDAPPPAWLFPYTQSLPGNLGAILLKSYRLLLSLFGIHFALHEIFRLGPLFFVEILGPKIVGLRGEPWMNPPDAFGSFSAVFEKGLAGWWGSFWHQMFRFAFEAPTTRILEFLKINQRSEIGKLLGLVIAFFLSGCLHACGSYTQLGDTRPILGPFMFFQWQTVGVVGQMLMAKQLKGAGITDRMPKWIRQMTNFLVTIVWMYWTAPLLVDDFAKGGVWLYEPLAFSPLRALGFGAPDDRSWDLWYGLIFWHQGEHWWSTGLAF